MLLYYFSRGINRLMTKLKWDRPQLTHKFPKHNVPKKLKREMNKHWLFMPFGKYKNIQYASLPRDYLEWAAINIAHPEVRMLLTTELKRRKRNNLD